MADTKVNLNATIAHKPWVHQRSIDNDYGYFDSESRGQCPCGATGTWCRSSVTSNDWVTKHEQDTAVTTGSDTLTAIDQWTQQEITGVLRSFDSRLDLKTVFVTLAVDGHLHRARISRDVLVASGARPLEMPFASDALLWRIIELNYGGHADHALAELQVREVMAAEQAERDAWHRRMVMLDSAAALVGAR